LQFVKLDFVRGSPEIKIPILTEILVFLAIIFDNRVPWYMQLRDFWVHILVIVKGTTLTMHHVFFHLNSNKIRITI